MRLESKTITISKRYRTRDKGDTWNIVWTKEYYTRRIVYTNEEVSFEKAYNMIAPLIKEARTMYENINFQFSKGTGAFHDEIFNHAKRMKDIYLQSGGIPYVDAKYESFMERGLAYISAVEQLYTDIEIFLKRGNNDKFLVYWFGKLAQKCISCEDELIQICRELKIDIAFV